MTTTPRPTETPIVACTARRAADGIWTLVVEACPFCRVGRHPGRHVHGGGSGPHPDGGSRLSHCLADAQEYWLVTVEAS
jgi:hypothetical protein